MADSLSSQVLNFFNNDDSFFNKMNVRPEQVFEYCSKGNLKFIKHDRAFGKLYFSYLDKYQLVTDYSVGTIIQMFYSKNYQLPETYKKKYVVIDIGMNKGFSSLWFAIDNNCIAVEGFEINPRLEAFINENIELNHPVSDKIHYNPYGLADQDGMLKIFDLKNDDGITTMISDFYSNYWSDTRKRGMKSTFVAVKKASKELRRIIEKYPDTSMLLKIDVEGAEYTIFPDLLTAGLLSKFDLIMGETHNGFDPIAANLKNFRILSLENVGKNLHTFIAANKALNK